MALGVVLLRAEHRSCLKHPVKHAYHDLLIELRALGQDCRTVKIVQAENIGTAFRPSRSDLGGVDLGEALLG